MAVELFSFCVYVVLLESICSVTVSGHSSGG